MSDLPIPIPAEGAWSPDATDLPNWDAMPRRNRRRRRRAGYPIWLKYLAWCIGVAAIVTMAQIAIQTVRSDPRDSRVYTERELRLSVLRPNEKVLAQVSVWQRPAIDYFRPTRGLLVVTDAPGDSANPIGGRLIYLGLQPRDPLSPPDAPPTFDERDWPVDTTVSLTSTRTLFYLARALRVATPRERLTVGVPSPASADADSLIWAVNKKYSLMRAVGWQRREARRARDRATQIAVYQGRREWYHTVQRGEALGSVARMFSTTPELLRALNAMSGDKIKIGQKLKVKGWTQAPVPMPA
ncbi:MAG: LysM peptidoglycan-binding domain-containing protein, partial [bacterium]